MLWLVHYTTYQLSLFFRMFALLSAPLKEPRTQAPGPRSLTLVPPLFAVPIWLAKLLNFSPNLLRLLLSIFITRILYVLAHIAYT